MTSGVTTIPPLTGPGGGPRRARVWRRIRAHLGEISPQTLLSRELVDPQVIGRLGGLFFAVGALGALATMPFRPLTEEQRIGVVVICAGAFAVAALAWLAPWRQLPASSTLVLVPVGLLFGTIGYAASINPYEMTAYYVTGFVWIGIAHERGTSMRIMPFMMLVYLVPVLLVPSTDPRMAFSGLVSLTVFCVIVGETLAWLVASLRRVHEELAIRRTATRYRALVQNAADLVAVVGADATIHFVTPSVERLLGYRASELTTRRLTELFADETVNGALQLLERLARRPGASATQEWRIAHADGSVRVVEVVAVNLAEDPDIGGIVVTGRDVTERHALEAQLSHEALHDALTGLANRLLFQDRLAHALARSSRHPEQVAVLFLDLDEFKDVNDSLGHQAGDSVLQVVATRLRATVRASDTVARLGGDEFAVLVEDAEDSAALVELGERLLAAVRRPIRVDDTELVLGASIGIVLDDAGTEDAAALVRDADIAMYAAKELGKDRVELFDPRMQVRITERLHLVNDLRRTIDEGELEVLYQPFFELASGRPVGAEALVRWQHPQRGRLLPGAFIGAAETSGLIVGLGGYVLRQACTTAQAWATPDADVGIVSVNLSPRQFGDEQLLATIRDVLDRSGLCPRRLVLEITENVLIGDLPGARAKLQALREMGVRVAIDDFGMGYSSLHYLRALPVDILKIDRAFVSGLGSEDGADALVAAIVEMARVMGPETIAEAVETSAEATRLRELGVGLIQGFHLARPMPAAAIAGIWANGGRLDERPSPEAATQVPAAVVAGAAAEGAGGVARSLATTRASARDASHLGTVL